MIRIKRIQKVLSLFIIGVFLLGNNVYSMPIECKTLLRAPLKFRAEKVNVLAGTYWRRDLS
jgi:hypothetical protein